MPVLRNQADGATDEFSPRKTAMHYDLLVIGSGPSGQKGAIAAAYPLGRGHGPVDHLYRLGAGPGVS